MPFAQLVVGPPGSGKSTFCDGMQQFLHAIDRNCAVINLDPANDHTSYPCALDVRDLVPLEEVMEQESLGPNGGVLYALEELEHNIEWFEERLKEIKDEYLVIDCPGQVELFTHHNSLPTIFHRLEKLGYRLVVVQLLDSHALSQPTLWISSLLLTLRSMLHFPYPLVNVLSKIDNLSKAEPLPFNLDYYTEVQDLSYLLPHLEAEQAGFSKWTRLNEALIQLVDDFGLVSFQPLAVEDKASMAALVRAIDRASGFVFGVDAKGGLSNEEGVWASAMQEGWGQMDIADVQERWIDRREEFDELERKQWEEEAREAGANADVRGSVIRTEGMEEGRIPSVQELEAAAKKRDGTAGRPAREVDDEDLEALQEAFLKQTKTAAATMTR
ncbi:hypothetical protein ANO11243_030790 [Dothideomycetidae sp. 11243]|nr:hypothetical protein ANO11243_030790 [fungal sp. No.11243]